MYKDTGRIEPIDRLTVVRETEKGNADLIFRIGETVMVKGGDFRVKSFGKKFMILEGIPGTRIRK